GQVESAVLIGPRGAEGREVAARLAQRHAVGRAEGEGVAARIAICPVAVVIEVAEAGLRGARERFGHALRSRARIRLAVSRAKVVAIARLIQERDAGKAGRTIGETA